MKTLTNNLIALLALVFVASGVNAQSLQYSRPTGQAGLNVFETPKTTDVTFDGVKVIVGGDFALQFQGLSQSSNDIGIDSLELDNNFNLPTANLNIDVQLEDGMRMHLRTYLSSQHHPEAYVKGGYLQIDRLDWIAPDFLSEVMDIATIRVGMDQFNYGDAQFRRSDNAMAIYNPFVGNYIMDAFTTEPFMEVTVQSNGLLGVLGVTNGRLNQNVLENTDDGIVIFGKAGYDSQINEDLRVRLTGSFYNSTDKNTRENLYAGDRSGARYYRVLNASSSYFRNGRFNPGFTYQTAFQINPFVKFQGVEFFGVVEMVTNGDDEVGGGYTQLGAELLYRFGTTENLYFGGRYNSVSGEKNDASDTQSINRLNIGGGWFLTNNVLTKLEYVKQSYTDGWENTSFDGAEFSGLFIEAVISF